MADKLEILDVKSTDMHTQLLESLNEFNESGDIRDYPCQMKKRRSCTN